MAGGANPVKAIIAALFANAAIAVAKFAAAAVTGSGSMLAEAVHSTADCGNQGLLLLGIRRAKQPPSSDYPLGFGKETYFWSFIVALMLFSLGGLFSLYEGWHKLHEPEPLNHALIALAVLGFGIIAEAMSMRACLQEVAKLRGRLSLWQWFRQSRQVELVVIFGEDLAALLGLVFAFAAVTISWLTGDPFYDALGSMAIGALLIIVALFIGRKVMAMLIGQGVDERTRQDMIGFLEQQQDVHKVFNCVTLQLGADVMVAVKVKMRPLTTAAELIDAINRTEQAFRREFPQVLWLFFEPDHQD